MRFLIDAQLPPALAGLLRSKGFEARHVRDLGLRDSADHEICSFAAQERYIVLTKDRDYLDLARRPGAAFRIVWLGCGNGSNRVLFSFVEARWIVIERGLRGGGAVIEIT